MKIQSGLGTSYSPAFKKFQIENDIKNPESCYSPSEIRGTPQFLSEETVLIKKTKLEKQKPKTIEPLTRIIELIKRQQTNPFDMVLYSVHGKTPKEDKVFFEIKDPKGIVLYKKELKNEIKLVETKDNDFNISSDLYETLEMGEKQVDKLNTATNKSF